MHFRFFNVLAHFHLSCLKQVSSAAKSVITNNYKSSVGGIKTHSPASQPFYHSFAEANTSKVKTERLENHLKFICYSLCHGNEKETSLDKT